METILDAQASNGNVARSLAGFFDDLVRTETRLYNELNDRLRRGHELFASQYEFLTFVRQHPGCRVVDLASTFAVGVGATSKGVDRLEARGWLQRNRSETDRRAVLLTLTPAGRQLLDDADRTFEAMMADCVGSVLTHTQLLAATSALAPLRETLQQSGIGTPSG